MLLNEFFKFDAEDNDFKNDRRYDPKNDKSVLKLNDTRKIRLTLKQINQLRLQSEAHEAEKVAEQGFVKQMYGNPPEAEEL